MEKHIFLTVVAASEGGVCSSTVDKVRNITLEMHILSCLAMFELDGWIWGLLLLVVFFPSYIQSLIEPLMLRC